MGKVLLKRGSTLFLKVVIILIAIGALAGLIWFPQTEGRATNLDLISIYKDPLIIYAYIGSIPFFVALYQAFKLLGYIDGNKVFSQSSVNAVRNIKYCAITISGFIVLGILYIRLFVRGEDPAGVTALVVRPLNSWKTCPDKNQICLEHLILKIKWSHH